MNLHLASDLHLEISNMQPAERTRSADVVLLAGDIWTGDKGIYWARATWPDQEIIYIAGNHEFYDRNFFETKSLLRIAARDTGVHFLDDEEVVLKGVRFLGSTLWTDLRLFRNRYSMSILRDYSGDLQDFKLIRTSNEPIKKFDLRYMLSLNKHSVDFLSAKLHEPYDGVTVVITHHAPSSISLHPRWSGNPVSAFFASSLENLFGLPNLWVHGHTHDAVEYVFNGTRVVSNPRGYDDGAFREPTGFDPGLLISL